MSRLSLMIHNPAYVGRLMLRSESGEVVLSRRPAGGRRDRTAAQAALTRNRAFSRKNAIRDYLLRGLVQCGGRGRRFIGSATRLQSGKGAERRYCRCGSMPDSKGLRRTGPPCKAKAIHAMWLENDVWTDIRRHVYDPGDTLAEAQRQLRERQAQATGFEDRRRQILQQLAEQESERERILTMYRKGRISTEEAEGQLDAIARETGAPRELAEGLRAQDALIQAKEAHLTDAATMLARLRRELEEIERTDDLARKREVIELLVGRIVIHTEGEGWHKTATATIPCAISRPKDVAVSSTRTSAEPPAG